ncbi:MAG: hypothetical protein F6K62_01645 [Sphaerospermopsis sp. SIO1G2]|nr:hypothetical protein [Sphaerospermopsis sp. SIO1G2]
MENPSTLLDRISETGFTPPKLTGLDAYLEEQRKEYIFKSWQKLEDYIQEDPEHLLRNCHPKENPDCNCQYLAQKLLLQDPREKLTKIAKKLDIIYSTLNSHWKNKCLPLLQKILGDLGYSLEE